MHNGDTKTFSTKLSKFVENCMNPDARSGRLKVFVAMGETGSSTFLAQRLHDELGVEAIVPSSGKSYILN